MRCTIYTQRPNTCQDFKCKLLRNIEKGKTSKPEAMSIIEQTKSVHSVITSLLEKFDFKIDTQALKPMLVKIRKEIETGKGNGYQEKKDILKRSLTLEIMLQKYFLNKMGN